VGCFNGGVHQQNRRRRRRGGLEPFRIVIDEARNGATNGREACFRADGSRTALWVVPLDEELQIARAPVRLLGTKDRVSS
jgi:acetate kinase